MSRSEFSANLGLVPIPPRFDDEESRRRDAQRAKELARIRVVMDRHRRQQRWWKRRMRCLARMLRIRRG